MIFQVQEAKHSIDLNFDFEGFFILWFYFISSISKPVKIMIWYPLGDSVIFEVFHDLFIFLILLWLGPKRMLSAVKALFNSPAIIAYAVGFSIFFLAKFFSLVFV